GLSPQEAGSMAPHTPLRPRQVRCPAHPRPQTRERLGVRGVDDQALPERIERPNEAKGIVAQSRGDGPQDRRVHSYLRREHHRSEEVLKISSGPWTTRIELGGAA